MLLAVPNISEGRDEATVQAIAEAFTRTGDARLLDVHSDPDHHRSVYTLAGPPRALCDALLCGAREAVARVAVVGSSDASDQGADGNDQGFVADVSEIDARAGRPAHAPGGQHPHVGAIDVAPIVYLDPADRGVAIAEALVLADRVGEELAVPVFLYGELAGGRERAQLRSGGVAGLAGRLAAGELRPDFGPARLHPSAGATLVAAREPLVAFNVQLAPPATLADARAIAAAIREGGAEGLPGLRAIGVELGRSAAGASAEPSGAVGAVAALAGPAASLARADAGGTVAQVSTNVERPLELPLAAVLARVRAHARVASAELVGLAPAAALEGFPTEVPLVGFDPERHVLENALGL